MKYDNETQKLMGYAVEDLRLYMANAGRDTTEAAITAWQQGYISGMNRAIGIRNDQVAPEEA